MPHIPETSSGMIDSLASNIVHPCPIWRIISRDGITAAYCSHSRPSIGRLWNPFQRFIFNSVTYKPTPAGNTRDMHRIGLSPNSTQISGVFDDIITRADVEGGRWKLAKVVYEYVDYLDLSLGSTAKIVGVVGQITTKGPIYEMEFLSNANILQQQIGDLTSPTDRNAFPAGVDKNDWTITRNVDSSLDRRHLVIDGASKPDHYFRYGILVVTTGANSISPGMEIKDNVGNTIELVLPMPRDFSGGDIVTLLAGYEGTREQARDRFSDAEDIDCEPDVPGIREILSYPE